MKRYVRGFVAIIATLAFTGGVAHAQDTTSCSGATISHTGPGSENIIECVKASDIRVSCVNGIYVVNDNSQSAGSGNATTGGNTTGGNAVTGNATNENNTTVQIGASCVAQPAVTTPEAPKPAAPVAPQQVGGMGAGAGVAAPAPRQAATAVATLPNTSNNPALDNALVAGTGLTGLLIASQLGIAAYRRLALR